MKSSTSHPDIQGEDDYVSAEKYNQKYNQKMRAFDDSGKVEEAANDPTSSNAYEDAALRMDEAKLRAHAKAMRGRMEICLDATSRPIQVTITRAPPCKWTKPKSVTTPMH
ncbi:MAG: hypothetical protein Q8K52_10970 [Thiobacillus sp.]|nr:hypothetical protein [Thiobacillus sp.]